MPWFKVDDSLAFHAKVVAAGNAAMGLWVRAGAWCSQQLTDGHVPVHMVTALGKVAEARRLVDAGLWVQTEDGYDFHEWSQCNPSATEVRAERATKHEVKSRAGRAGGIASGVARRKHERSSSEAEVLPASEADVKQNEAPSRPVPSSTSGTRKRAHATPVPDDFEVTDAMKDWWREHCPLVTDPVAETRQFLDHARANGKTFKDWPAAWRTWMGNAQRFASQRPANVRALPSRQMPPGTHPHLAHLWEQG